MSSDDRQTWRAATVAAAIVLLSVVASPAAVIERKGIIQVVGTISYKSAIPANTAISVEASAALQSEAPTFHAQNTSANTSIKRSGNTATVTLTLHYTWRFEAANPTVTVGMSVSADTPARPNSQIYVAIPLPANNATTKVRIPAAL